MVSFWANVIIHVTALTLEPGSKYSQYVNKSFRITMASLDITRASDRPTQVIMIYEQIRFLLCTLHKDKLWQVQLDILVPKETVVTLSCNGGSTVHLTGHYRIDLIEPPFNNPNWITYLSWQILNEKVNDLKSKGICLEELIEYLNKYTTAKIQDNWIVTPYFIIKEQIQEDRIPLQIPNLKRKSFVKDNRMKKTKCVRSLLHCNENINFNSSPSENPSKIPSEDSSESSSEDSSESSSEDSSENFSEDFSKSSSEDSSESFIQDSSMESNDDDEESDKENKSPIYRLRSKIIQKNGRKNENRKKQQKAKVIEKKSKEKDSDKTKKNSKQQDVRIIKGGVKVQELRPGTGKIAEIGKYVTIHYVAYVKTGQMLKEYDRFENLGLRFKLGAKFVINGLDVGVIGMKIDEKRRLIIPPKMAFRDESYGLKVPPNSTVVYDVELKKVE
ncbi:PREDICTED: 46 kDa FK506-binding nuclear protein [Trachymyrmex cornetzi]|uniref:46 kDa FK506-binding nuclear protein n=1 Tax=Trachymyrmex cornetzi TaxID=471704 RepID=UPI00084F2862|nr:PREDICTED: 46 kDa FK506-binding nuclear protein [Trachymyrmex cornetzi]